MKKIVLTFGIIAGLINAGMLIIFLAMNSDSPDFDNGELLGYSSMVLAFSMIAVAVYNYREKYNGGVISFGKAFKIGILVSLIASSIYMITWEIEYYNFMPDFGDKYAQHMIDKKKESGATEKEVQAFEKEMKQQMEYYKNPFINAALTMAEPIPVALPMTLIVALIFKRKTPKAKAAI